MPPGNALGRLVVVVATVAVLLVAIGSTLSLFSPGTTASFTPSSSSTSGFVSYSTGQTTAGSSSVSIDGSLAAYCPTGQVNGSRFMDAVAGTGSPAVFCVQFYYYDSFTGYNASSPLMLNVSDALSIVAVEEVLSDGLVYHQTFDGGPNFTVAASQSQLAIGGPTNENEGAWVAYAVTANPEASGAYELGLFASNGLTTWLLNPQAPESCVYYGKVTAGFGQPNYAQDVGDCTTYSGDSLYSTATETSGSTYYTLPGIPYHLLIGNIYFSMVGITNSTG